MKNTLLSILIGLSLITFQAHAKKSHKPKHKHAPGYSEASKYFPKKSRSLASEKKKKHKKSDKSVVKKTKKAKKHRA